MSFNLIKKEEQLFGHMTKLFEKIPDKKLIELLDKQFDEIIYFFGFKQSPYFRFAYNLNKGESDKQLLIPDISFESVSGMDYINISTQKWEICVENLKSNKYLNENCFTKVNRLTCLYDLLDYLKIRNINKNILDSITYQSGEFFLDLEGRKVVLGFDNKNETTLVATNIRTLEDYSALLNNEQRQDDDFWNDF